RSHDVARAIRHAADAPATPLPTRRVSQRVKCFGVRARALASRSRCPRSGSCPTNARAIAGAGRVQALPRPTRPVAAPPINTARRRIGSLDEVIQRGVGDVFFAVGPRPTPPERERLFPGGLEVFEAEGQESGLEQATPDPGGGRVV